MTATEHKALADVVQHALTEDLGGTPGRDVTSQAIFAADDTCVGHVVARKPGVVCGLAAFDYATAQAADRLGVSAPQVTHQVSDGATVTAGQKMVVLTGSTLALLIAERTALNVASRLSGIATTTSQWVQALAGTGAAVLDTRKTTPGTRVLDKFAVRCGGGVNKRMGLHDVAMIKDNHKIAAGSLTAAIQAVRAYDSQVALEVEVTTLAEALEALAAEARFLMCDNMSVPQLAQVVQQVRAATEDRVEIEATGGLTVEMAADVAATGVDYLSVGGLTHSAPILDIALDFAM